MYGENQAEYGNAIEENTNPLMNMDFFSVENNEDSFGGVPMKRIYQSLITLNQILPIFLQKRI